MLIRPLLLSSLAALFTLSTSTVASAGVCDLTSNGATCGPSVLTNFAIFGEVSPQPTGTGYIDPFLRLQNNGQESGYNTSARPFQLDQKEPITSRTTRCSLRCRSRRSTVCNTGSSSSISTSPIGDESSPVARRAPHLSVTNRHSQLVPCDQQKLNGLTAIYDLDGGGDNWIKLDYSLNRGSGDGDMVAYIPNSLFTGAGSQSSTSTPALAIKRAPTLTLTRDSRNGGLDPRR